MDLIRAREIFGDRVIPNVTWDRVALLPDKLETAPMNVYRVCDSGCSCKEDFQSTCIEKKRKNLRPAKGQDPNSISYHGTSVNTTYERAQRVLAMKQDFHPRAIIVEGVISHNIHGIYQFSHKYREYKDVTHIDFWIYEDGTPELDFTEVKL